MRVSHAFVRCVGIRYEVTLFSHVFVADGRFLPGCSLDPRIYEVVGWESQKGHACLAASSSSTNPETQRTGSPTRYSPAHAR